MKLAGVVRGVEIKKCRDNVCLQNMVCDCKDIKSHNRLASAEVVVDREAIISALNKSGCFRVCPIQAREKTAQAIATAIESGAIIRLKENNEKDDYCKDGLEGLNA